MRLALAVAAIGPVAVGGVLAARTGDLQPMLAAPAVVFGVAAATGPALYIAIAAAGSAPSLAAVFRAFCLAVGAFGIGLAGLLLPATFLALSSVSPATTAIATSAAIAGAGYLGLRRLARELKDARSATPRASALGTVVFVVWALATVGIAGPLWWDLAAEVAS
jgi:hypothetical protein